MRIFLCLLGHLNADWGSEFGIGPSGPEWDDWSAWSACTDPCGAEGTHTRSRQCRNGDPGKGRKLILIFLVKGQRYSDELHFEPFFWTQISLFIRT